MYVTCYLEKNTCSINKSSVTLCNLEYYKESLIYEKKYLSYPIIVLRCVPWRK